MIGVWDRDRNGHTPPLASTFYKILFLCRQAGLAGPPSELETMEVAWSAWDSLPPLSVGRVTQEELDAALTHHRDPRLPTEWD